jgi:hypothetical protein
MEQPRQKRMQDFIFTRELAEVYLLLDHISGRADKSLLAAVGGGDVKIGEDWIQKICQIGWPPKGTEFEQAQQAATLMMAKDRLNAAAKPANGATIAFTLLVAGDDDVAAGGLKHGRRHRVGSWIGCGRAAKRAQAPVNQSTGGKSPPAAEAQPTDEDKGKAAEPMPDGSTSTPAAETNPAATGAVEAPSEPAGPNKGGGPATEINAFGAAGPPTRMSLARLAFPGLAGRAITFNRWMIVIFILLIIWLIITCTLSWNVAIGRAILARVDAVETAKAAILEKISNAEIE